MEASAAIGTDWASRSNLNDDSYTDFIARIQARFATNTDNGARPLFRTDVEEMFPAYLETFDASERQHHNCSACRHFVRQYGGLVVIGDDGITTPALWDEEDAPELYKPAIRVLAKMVRRAKVVSPFFATERTWGQPLTGDWQHMAIVEAPSQYLRHRAYNIATAGQQMAEKVQDYQTVSRALAEFTEEHLATALALLKTDTLYRSEKVIGPATFLAELHTARAAAKGSDARKNVVWLATAKAPAGFCHPRSSMVGSLLEDIAAGKSMDDVARAFKAKMHPLQYQRPQAAPSVGTIQQAEKLVEQMGIAASLRRRFAKLEDLQLVWSPKAAEPAQQKGGVFGHLLGESSAPKQLSSTPIVLTWEKFARTVLPDAESIELQVPAHGNFCAYVTAADPDAPPILQWDLPERRNPVSLYVYNGASPASRWQLQAGEWAKVTGISLRPARWHDDTRFAHHGSGVLFVLDGARETNCRELALFPHDLKSELHSVRAVIEAHSKSGRIEGAEDASACGYMIGKEGGGARVRVTVAGHQVLYVVDRVED